MSSESKLINLDNAPFKIFDLSATTVSEKVVLKKRLKNELSQVVSAADHIDAQLKRMLSHKFLVTADNCKSLSGNDCLSRGLKNTCEQAYAPGLCEGEEQPVYDEQLSPSKTLHGAMLKSRFTDTILKAKQRMLLSNGEKGDLKMQQEREKLKRKLRKGEEQPVYEKQLPPRKALPAVMLKSRFADTILKAQQKILLSNGEKDDLAKMQQEREKLKRKLQEGQGEMETEGKVFSCCSKHLEEMLEDFGVERIYERGFYLLL